MSTKVADHVLQRLREWNVEHAFGYPGDGINGLLAAWGRAEDQPQLGQMLLGAPHPSPPIASSNRLA